MLLCSNKVRQLFENPSCSSDSRFLWREVASRLHDRLSVMKMNVDRLVDVGCGQGDDLALLKDRFPQSFSVGVDGALAPLAKASHRAVERGMACLCGNAETMLFQPETFNLVWSNMMLHWAEDIGAVLSNWHQMLRQDGLLLFACLGYGSLHNLYQAFDGIDGYDHIMTFPDCQQLGEALVRSGFPAPVLEREWLDLTYQDIRSLFRDIRSLGGNPLADRRQGLMGRRTFNQLLENLENLRDGSGKITLRFEIIIGHAFKENLPDIVQERPIGFYR